MSPLLVVLPISNSAIKRNAEMHGYHANSCKKLCLLVARTCSSTGKPEFTGYNRKKPGLSGSKATLNVDLEEAKARRGAGGCGEKKCTRYEKTPHRDNICAKTYNWSTQDTPAD